MPAYNPEGGFYWVGTDEKYGVKGGNDQVAHRMAAKLPAASIHTSSALVALKRRADGSYLCTFESQMQTFDVPADYVVLALPFTTLRRVDLSKAGFSPLKMTSIQKLPLGTNTKIYVQFRDRPWYKMGYNGATYADTGYQQTLEATRGQAGASGILEFYTGGHTGASFGPASFAPPSDDVVRKQMKGLLYPGILPMERQSVHGLLDRRPLVQRIVRMGVGNARLRRRGRRAPRQRAFAEHTAVVTFKAS
jgi:monoamine oxidase